MSNRVKEMARAIDSLKVDMNTMLVDTVEFEEGRAWMRKLHYIQQDLKNLGNKQKQSLVKHVSTPDLIGFVKALHERLLELKSQQEDPQLPTD